MTTSPTTRPPGMYDVAKLAGVSHQTVSRVLNDHPNVRPETRERVRVAIAQLGYTRNVAARALVTRRSSTIGVVTSGSALWGPSSALMAVERAARRAGYYVSVASLNGSEEPSRIGDVLQYFTSQGVDGIVIIAPEATMAHAADPFLANIPVVMVAAGATAAAGVHVTSVDQAAGAQMATRYLLDRGHTEIAHIAGPLAWFDATARLQGWKAELKKARVRLGTMLIGDWTSDSGYTAGLKLLKDKLPTAVFAANDLMALGLIHALTDAGVRVPEDISVVGFDDMPGAEHLIPPLTTVRQDLEALGQQCISMLLSVMDDRHREYLPLRPELVIRNSVAPPSKPNG